MAPKENQEVKQNAIGKALNLPVRHVATKSGRRGLNLPTMATNVSTFFTIPVIIARHILISGIFVGIALFVMDFIYLSVLYLIICERR